MRLTGVYFTTKAEYRVADACADDGAVLGLVINDFVFTILDVVSGSFGPSFW